MKKVPEILSVIIPARDEALNLPSMLHELTKELNSNSINYEILVIDDGSKDDTRSIIENLKSKNKSLHYIKNFGENGFGRAVRLGLEKFSGDAVTIMMADQSDSPNDLVHYWNKIQKETVDCVFGSRFIKGAHTTIRK